MPDVATPLPPAALSLAVATWYAGRAKSVSLTFHVWEHLLAAGTLRIEPDEDDQNVTHTIYSLDVTPTPEPPLREETPDRPRLTWAEQVRLEADNRARAARERHHD